VKKKTKKTKSLRSLKEKVWKLFSQYIRRSHADEGGTVSCYTCGELMFWKDAHAGHAIGGRHNAVLFDEDIVKPQCPRENLFLGGQYGIFAAKLIREHGLEWYEQKQIDSRKVVKYTRSDLEDLILQYEEKLAALDLKRAA
jgi:hypothetical protein